MSKVAESKQIKQDVSGIVILPLTKHVSNFWLEFDTQVSYHKFLVSDTSPYKVNWYYLVKTPKEPVLPDIPNFRLKLFCNF